MSKDAAIFSKGKTKGEIRYKPCEIQDADIAKQHAKFQVYPMGQIGDYPRAIPYNSDKKAFSEKTGREGFEVFQYTFRVPDEDKEYTVMWDYNVGLTTPAKMLHNNKGLKDISHSITGGALAAQAKAIAATFCYNIRYALTPVFGVDFLSICIEPGDPKFGHMVINSDVVRRCTEEASGFRALSREGSMASSPRTPPPSSKGYRKVSPRSLRPRPVQTLESESGYGTDTDRSDDYLYSPAASSGSGWTALNTPRSVASQQYQRLTLDQLSCAYNGQQKSVPQVYKPKSGNEVSSRKRVRSDDEEEYEEGSSSDHSSLDTPMPDISKEKTSSLWQERRAAYQLLQLRMDDAAIDGDRSRRRRAST
ncbi:MAG: hypothetical protein Q9195_001848 [Heterodermia aff. obscurata]